MANKTDDYNQMIARQETFLASMGKDINLYHERKKNIASLDLSKTALSKDQMLTMTARFCFILAGVLFAQSGSEERRVGKECSDPFSSRGCPAQ